MSTVHGWSRRPGSPSGTARRALRGLAAAAVLAALAVPALLAAPASAASSGPVTSAVPGLTAVDASSVTDSSTSKSVTAFCPAGTVVIGTAARTGGFFGSPSNNEVILERVVPFATAVTAQASEDESGFTGTWSVTATAICASPLPGLVRFSLATASDSTARKGKSATCPAGTQLVGLGGSIISTSPGQVRLEALSANLLGPNVVANEDETGFAGNWSVQVHAICATPPAGLQLVNVVSPVSSDSRVLVSAQCPSGKRLLGTGAVIRILSGSFGQVGLESLIESPLPSVGPPTAHLAFASEDQNGFAGTWTLTSQAICASI